MRTLARNALRGFTLIELLTALLILSLLAVMSYRGLGTVLDTRERLKLETDKWRGVAAFFARFERDVRLAAPRPVRDASAVAPAWRGTVDASHSRLEFSRFAPDEGIGSAQRLGYALNAKSEIELSLWPGLDIAPNVAPARYPMLSGVRQFELHYLTRGLAWVDEWPAPVDDAIPRAVLLRIVLASGEEIVRIFALQS